MNFSEALTLLQQGRCVRRRMWDNSQGTLKHGFLKINKLFCNDVIDLMQNKIESAHPWSAYSTDLLANDWEVIND